MRLPKFLSFVMLFVLITICGHCCAGTAKSPLNPPAGQWRALHLINYGSDEALDGLGKEIPTLAGMGINVLILEVNYGFEFKSHPELRMGRAQITRDGARGLVKICRENGIRLIPQFNCLGHQSWSKRTYPLLAKYPELDLTPGAFPGNLGVSVGSLIGSPFLCVGFYVFSGQWRFTGDRRRCGLLIGPTLGGTVAKGPGRSEAHSSREGTP